MCPHFLYLDWVIRLLHWIAKLLNFMPVLATNTDTLAGNLFRITYKYYGCYESNDRDTMETLLTEDFVFSSLNDDRIDRTTYFDKCWTSGVKMQAVFHFKKIFEDEDDVFLLYVCHPE